ncbi:protein FAM189B-like [Sphaerodactylus townsendi]|uniref:protein FAM189B-like n=1 Tax=Sphaerodactylus townsendi TaxID=933632 RepID=UPI002026DBD7|nr:protein FAM189B-like [Sphaerodactylus townsendi]
MPSRSDSSYSLTGHTSHSFTHLRVQRAWLQAILLLGFIQMVLGVLIVTFSLLVTTIVPGQSIRNSCPIWAGFPLAFSGLVGIVSWRRPFTPVITFFTLLSVLGIMLSLAGSVLSCQNAQMIRSLDPSCQLPSSVVKGHPSSQRGTNATQGVPETKRKSLERVEIDSLCKLSMPGKRDRLLTSRNKLPTGKRVTSQR